MLSITTINKTYSDYKNSYFFVKVKNFTYICTGINKTKGIMDKNFIAYYRVSTDEQGDSGLGLSAQRRAVTSYVYDNGVLRGEFEDIESGASTSRVGIMRAIEACKKHGATLVVKELSRITRGGYKYRQMMDELGIEFIECSSPHDPEVVKDIKFSLAKEERNKVRKRTKDALSEINAKLKRGDVHVSKSGNVITSLGNPQNLTDASRERSIEVRVKKALNNPNNVKAGAFIISLRGNGKSFMEISDMLNVNGFRTSRGNMFSVTQVRRLYKRYA